MFIDSDELLPSMIRSKLSSDGQKNSRQIQHFTFMINWINDNYKRKILTNDQVLVLIIELIRVEVRLDLRVQTAFLQVSRRYFVTKEKLTCYRRLRLFRLTKYYIM